MAKSGVRSRAASKAESPPAKTAKAAAKGAPAKASTAKTAAAKPAREKPVKDKAVKDKTVKEKAETTKPAKAGPVTKPARAASAKAAPAKAAAAKAPVAAKAASPKMPAAKAAAPKTPAPKTPAPKTPAPKPEAAKPAAAPRPAPTPSPKAAFAAQPVPQGEEAEDRDPFANAGADIERIAENSAEIVAELAKTATAYLKGVERGEVKPSESGEEATDIVKTFSSVAERWFGAPEKTGQLQKKVSDDMMAFWNATLKTMQGEKADPVVPPTRDNRFADPEWEKNPYFNALKQAYQLGSNWLDTMVNSAEGLDEHTRRKAQFYVRQLQGMLSPSNFVLTNPELLRTTLEEKGANLVRGMRMMAEDMERGQGNLRIRQTDDSGFEVGRNIANTPGKVVFRNELIELIQYTPTTGQVFEKPLLIVPPWINKFYVLDLNAEKSFIRWCVEQGLTVFTLSWVNPDERHKHMGFAEYMKLGPIAAVDEVLKITGQPSAHTVGYCVGGTMLSVTMAYLWAKGEGEKIASATLFTTQVDFTYAGDLLTFVDEESIAKVENKMKDKGYLAGSSMANAFNMLRPNDLIWNYYVNNYLKGKAPSSFDLLYWNSDSTRMPEANHSFYLRNCYLENNLAKGEMVVDGQKLSLKKVKTPIYNLAAREDHIAPAKSVFYGSQFFGGPVKYVLAGSGHIAGVVNPATKPKYQYWTGGEARGSYEDWVANAKETAGTWWLDWIKWVTDGDRQIAPRVPGAKGKVLGDAPGEYVRMKA